MEQNQRERKDCDDSQTFQEHRAISNPETETWLFVSWQAANFQRTNGQVVINSTENNCSEQK